MTAEEIFKAYENSSTPMPASVIKWIISHSEGMSKAFTTVLNNLQQNPPKKKKIQMGRNFSTSEYPLPNLITAVKQAERGTGLRIELLFPKRSIPNYESIMPNLNYKGLDKHLGVLSYPIIARNPKRGLSPQDASSAISYARRIALATILNLSSGNNAGGYSNGNFNNYGSYSRGYYNNNRQQYNGGSQYNNYQNRSYQGNQSNPMGNNNYQYGRQRYQNNNTRGNGGAPRNFNQAEASSSNTTSASPQQNQYRSSATPKPQNKKSTMASKKSVKHAPVKKLSASQAQNLKDAMNQMYSSTHMKKQGILRIIKSASGMTSSQRFPSQFPADKYNVVMKTVQSFIKPANKQKSKSRAK